jgi:hypothetical protein
MVRPKVEFGKSNLGFWRLRLQISRECCKFIAPVRAASGNRGEILGQATNLKARIARECSSSMGLHGARHNSRRDFEKMIRAERPPKISPPHRQMPRAPLDSSAPDGAAARSREWRPAREGGRMSLFQVRKSAIWSTSRLLRPAGHGLRPPGRQSRIDFPRGAHLDKLALIKRKPSHSRLFV